MSYPEFRVHWLLDKPAFACDVARACGVPAFRLACWVVRRRVFG